MERRCAYKVLVGKRERDHLKDLCMDGRKILKWDLKKQNVRDMEGLHVGENRNKYWALVNVTINIRFP
jgi:hypothetical protein